MLAAKMRLMGGEDTSPPLSLSTEEAKAQVQQIEAAEMENAGVAQICKAYDVPYLSLRALSDLITGDANKDFGEFCEQAANNVFPIHMHLVSNLKP